MSEIVINAQEADITTIHNVFCELGFTYSTTLDGHVYEKEGEPRFVFMT